MERESYYTPFHVANYFIEDSQLYIDKLKLQKLVYISYGFVYALTGKTLFDDDIQAWKYGPVVERLYYRTNEYVKGEIDKPLSMYSVELDNDITPEVKMDKNIEVIQILEYVKRSYGNREGGELINLTHREGTPWKITRDKKEHIIDKELIRKYYDKFIDTEVIKDSDAKLTEEEINTLLSKIE